MTKYIATIRHHSIRSAREIEINGTLDDAKREAAKEFGGEQRDYDIVIAEMSEGYPPYVVASRKVGGRKWTSPE